MQIQCFECYVLKPVSLFVMEQLAVHTKFSSCFFLLIFGEKLRLSIKPNRFRRSRCLSIERRSILYRPTTINMMIFNIYIYIIIIKAILITCASSSFSSFSLTLVFHRNCGSPLLHLQEIKNIKMFKPRIFIKTGVFRKKNNKRLLILNTTI